VYAGKITGPHWLCEAVALTRRATVLVKSATH
jgi:hypothetical protein